MTAPVYCIVVPLEPLAVGGWIRRDGWLRHITVCSNFRTSDDAVDALPGILRDTAAASAAPKATVRGDALFGPDGDIAVQLVESDGLRRLHSRLVDAFRARVPVDFVDPDHSGDGYRPHVTVVRGERLDPGHELRMTALTLVEIAPAGDPSTAVVVATAPFAADRSQVAPRLSE